MNISHLMSGRGVGLRLLDMGEPILANDPRSRTPRGAFTFRSIIMNRITQPTMHVAGVAALALTLGFSPPSWAANRPALTIEGRVVAIGIPGVSAISVVGTFLPGGPIHDKPALAAYTQPGAVLDPARLLVASTSNFGEPLANTDQLSGSLLSIDPRGGVPLIVPPAFAENGGQASALNGLLQMYSAQNGAFLNSIHNPGASTARYTGVASGPRTRPTVSKVLDLRRSMIRPGSRWLARPIRSWAASMQATSRRVCRIKSSRELSIRAPLARHCSADLPTARRKRSSPS
jgi:hypothetical protein